MCNCVITTADKVGFIANTTTETRTNIFRKCMKTVTDYSEITVAHGHINGIKLANSLRKKSQNISVFHWHKLKSLQISH